jgi:hypothetical protein
LRELLIALALLAAAFTAWRLDAFGFRGKGELERALTYRGRVAVQGANLLDLHAEGAQLVAVEQLPVLAAALRGSDPQHLLAAMRQLAVGALLLAPRAPGAHGNTLAERLSGYEHVLGLRGLYISLAGALYAPDPNQLLSPPEREALCVVARALIGGARPPRSSSFPEALRKLRPVEVMVLLREGERARLWRSARGTSIASALTTASLVARQRWQEREQAMGGPLDTALAKMYLDVALLEDDGTIGDRDPAFIDRVFFPDHGVGYERKGAWRYLLPEDTRDRGKGRASRAYRKLFVDDGLPEDSFTRHELRLYRLIVETLATSPPPRPKRDALSPIDTPDEILVPPTK